MGNIIFWLFPKEKVKKSSNEEKVQKSYTLPKKSHAFHNIYRKESEESNNYKPSVGEVAINEDVYVAPIMKARNEIKELFSLKNTTNNNSNCNGGVCKTLYKAIFEGGTRRKHKPIRKTIKHIKRQH